MRISVIVFVSVALVQLISEPCQCSNNHQPSCSSKTGSEDTEKCEEDAANRRKYDAESNLKPTWTKYYDSYKRATQSYQFPESFPYNSVIENDLTVFRQSGISRDMLDRSRREDRHAVTYVAVDGKLYRSKDCLFPARCQGVEHFLLAALEKVDDFELVLNTHDWPLINKYFQKPPPDHPPPATFSFSKTKDYLDIYFPAWTFWAGGPAISHYPTGLGRWDVMSKAMAESGRTWPWNRKRDAAFFRGSRTSEERDALIKLSRRFPQLVDAKFTKNQAWKSKADTLGAEPAEEIRLEDHCQYKYLFNFRGIAASFRFKHLFLCQSTVLHVGAEWSEFFYDQLVPWVHYVPLTDLQNNENDIRDLLEFLIAFPDVAQTIARNGRLFVESHLRIKDVQRYWEKLLKNYTKLLNFKPTLSKDLIEINE